jgi:hypothetical protein
VTISSRRPSCKRMRASDTARSASVRACPTTARRIVPTPVVSNRRANSSVRPRCWPTAVAKGGAGWTCAAGGLQGRREGRRRATPRAVAASPPPHSTQAAAGRQLRGRYGPAARRTLAPAGVPCAPSRRPWRRRTHRVSLGSAAPVRRQVQGVARHRRPRSARLNASCLRLPPAAAPGWPPVPPGR